MPIDVPPGLAACRERGPDWSRWLDELPRTAARMLDVWSLRPDGPGHHGHCSLVLPVRTDQDLPAALKLTFDGDEDSALEHLTLRRWAGEGAVRLLRAEPAHRALLIERLGPGDLTDAWDLQACETIGTLYRRLHVPALPQLTRLGSFLAPTLDRLDLTRGVLPPRQVDQCRRLAADLLDGPPSDDVLLHGDLHYENVLAAEREPWLVIDPKPVAGDRHYEPGPLLWNRWDELAGDVRGGVRRRFGAIVDAAGLDEDRARDWVVVRAVVTAAWTVTDAHDAHRPLTRDEQDRLTTMVTIVKSVQE